MAICAAKFSTHLQSFWTSIKWEFSIRKSSNTAKEKIGLQTVISSFVSTHFYWIFRLPIPKSISKSYFDFLLVNNDVMLSILVTDSKLSKKLEMFFYKSSSFALDKKWTCSDKSD